MTLPSQTSQPVSPWVDFSILGFVFLTLAGLSWAKGPDLITDFGMQAYIPWQLIMGKTLYVDIAWKYGPFSQYFNALLFGLFGVSLTTLYVANLSILAAITYLIYRLFLQFTDRVTTVCVGCVFLIVFGMAQYVWMGNWNYVTPYVPEATHSVALSLVLIFGLTQYNQSLHSKWLVVIGVCFGLICLTKIEAIVAIVAVIGGGIGLMAWINKWDFPLIRNVVGWIGISAVLPIMIGISLLCTQMPLQTAIAGVLSNLSLAMESDIAQSVFYKRTMGTDNIVQHLGAMSKIIGGLIVIVILGLGLERLSPHQVRTRRVLCGLILIGVTAAFLFPPVPWTRVLRPLPVITLLVIGCALRVGFRLRENKELWLKLFPCILWGIFSIGMLLKIFLKASPGVYGFIHAMPATLLWVASLLCFGPAIIRAKGFGSGALFRSAMAGLVAAFVLFYWQWSQSFLGQKTYSFGYAGDPIKTYSPIRQRDVEVLSLLRDDLAMRVNRNQTLVVLPEGILLNYLLRIPNPTPFLAFTPYDLVSFGGEAHTVQVMSTHPPDFIVLVHRSFSDWDYPFFGQDPKYGKLMMDWVKEHYTQVRVIGSEPGTGQKFGVAIWELKKGA
ncbi:MAG TPA: hypothetical protein PL157_19850 [Acidobacteriota bacterium]|nr:hypothetical protein [Acidobacteriota bacterium]